MFACRGVRRAVLRGEGSRSRLGSLLGSWGCGRGPIWMEYGGRVGRVGEIGWNMRRGYGSWRKNDLGDMEKVLDADWLRCQKGTGSVVMITAYDTPSATICDDFIDLLLVGDSLAMTVLGYDSTRYATLADMVRHVGAVSRGAKRALVVGDVPSESMGSVSAMVEAGLQLQEAGAGMVKVEGGNEVVLEGIRKLVEAGVDVCGHVGLLPQTAAKFTVQGKKAAEGARIVKECETLEAAGVSAVVLEMVPDEVAQVATQSISIPTIGIGAGPHTDGQVLVLHDVIGLYPNPPRFSKQFVDVAKEIESGVREYADNVREGRFPEESHSFPLKPKAKKEFQTLFPTISTPPATPLSNFPYRTGVIGNGAVGSWVAGKVRGGSKSVEVLGRGGGGDGEKWDVGVIATTADGVVEATKQAATRLNPNSTLFVFCNGPESGPIALETLKECSPHNVEVALVVMSKGVKLVDGKVVETKGGEVRIASIGTTRDPTSTPSPHLAPFSSLFQAKLLHTSPSSSLPSPPSSLDRILSLPDGIREVVVHKAVVNAVLNPMAALRGWTNGEFAQEMLQIPSVCHLAEETHPIFHLTHTTPPNILPHLAHLPETQAPILSAVYTVAQASAENVCSTLAAVRRGKKTEVESINGVLATCLQQAGYATPHHNSILQAFESIHKLNNTHT